MAQLLPPGMMLCVWKLPWWAPRWPSALTCGFVSKHFPWLQESFSSGGINSLCAGKLQFVL